MWCCINLFVWSSVTLCLSFDRYFLLSHHGHCSRPIPSDCACFIQILGCLYVICELADKFINSRIPFISFSLRQEFYIIKPSSCIVVFCWRNTRTSYLVHQNTRYTNHTGALIRVGFWAVLQAECLFSSRIQKVRIHYILNNSTYSVYKPGHLLVPQRCLGGLA